MTSFSSPPEASPEAIDNATYDRLSRERPHEVLFYLLLTSMYKLGCQHPNLDLSVLTDVIKAASSCLNGAAGAKSLSRALSMLDEMTGEDPKLVLATGILAGELQAERDRETLRRLFTTLGL